MVVAVIVENVLKEALTTDEELVQQVEAETELVMYDLFDIFRRMDLDQSGAISREEFKDGMANPKVEARLQRLDISFVDAEDIFDILDHDKSGTIMLEEFMEGCMKARGSAQAKDMLEVNCNMYQCIYLLNMIADGFDETKKRLDAIASQVMELGQSSGDNSVPASKSSAGATATPKGKSPSEQVFWDKVPVEATGAVAIAARSVLQDVDQHYEKVKACLAKAGWLERCPVRVADALLGLDSYYTEIEACLASDSECVPATCSFMQGEGKGSSFENPSRSSTSSQPFVPLCVEETQSYPSSLQSQTTVESLPAPIIYRRTKEQQTRIAL